MGRDQKVGAALTVLLGGLNGYFGFGGTVSDPMEPPNAPNDPKGLPFKDGNTLNAYIATRLRRDVYFDIKAFWELRGDGENAHQVYSRLQMNRKAFGAWETIVGAEVGLMFYKRNIHTETIAFTGLGFSF